MTAPSPGVEHTAPPWQKRAADLCTALRAPLALLLVWLGIQRGKDGIQMALLLLLVAVTLDTLDGYLARVSAWPQQTWIGSHDLTFDVGYSAAMLLYLTIAGYLAPYLAALYAVGWIGLFAYFAAHLSTLAVIFQAPIYLGILLAALVDDLSALVGLVLWAVVMLAFAGRRFFGVRVPAFFDSVLGKAHPLDHPSGDRRRLKE